MPCPLAQGLPGEKPGGLAPFFSLLCLGDIKASPPPLLARMWGFLGVLDPNALESHGARGIFWAIGPTALESLGAQSVLWVPDPV